MALQLLLHLDVKIIQNKIVSYLIQYHDSMYSKCPARKLDIFVDIVAVEFKSYSAKYKCMYKFLSMNCCEYRSMGFSLIFALYNAIV